MTRPAVALLSGLLLGALLVQSPWGPQATHLCYLLCLLASLLIGLSLLVACLRALPLGVRIVLLLPTLALSGQGLYFLLWHHWVLVGVGVFLGLLGVLALWRLPLPELTTRRGDRWACGLFLCGAAVAIQTAGAPAWELLSGLVHQRTPLGLAAHLGLLLGPVSLGVFGASLLSSSSGSAETALS